MPISTCLSNGRPTNAIHGDMLYETDTMRLIVYDTSQGAGNERWVFHDNSGFQFGTLTDLSLLNYANCKTTLNPASPYALSTSPEIHFDARFLDGVDPLNNPADGTTIAEIVNRINNIGSTFIWQSLTGAPAAPTYKIVGTDRVISSLSASEAALSKWQSDRTTPEVYDHDVGDYTVVHISRPYLNNPGITGFPLNHSSSVLGAYGFTTAANAGWPAHGIAQNYGFYSWHLSGSTNGGHYAGSYNAGQTVNNYLLATDPNGYTDAEKAAFIKNFYGEENSFRLDIGWKSGNQAYLYVNGQNVMTENQSAQATVLKAGSAAYTATGQMIFKGEVAETLIFESALGTSDLNKILDYAVATYNVGSVTGTKAF